MYIRISHLHSQMTNDSLRELFASFGEVHSAEIAMDVFTDLPRGYGFVDMPNDDDAKKAIAALHKMELGGSTISVEETVPAAVRSGSYKVGNSVGAYRFKKS